MHGENNWASLQIDTLRELTAISGLLTIIGILSLGMGWIRSLIAMSFTATAPILVYYSRDFIHEPVFLLCAIPALAGLLGILKNDHPKRSGILCGIGIGLMAATRETVVITLFAWMLASLILLYRQSHLQNRFVPLYRALRNTFQLLIIALATALVIIFFAYTSGGQRPAGFFDFFRTYFEYETTPGHEKPSTYFLSLLVLPKYSAGLWWSEAGILFAALTVYIGRSDQPHYLSSRFFCDAGLIHLIIYSIIPYKTPWLATLGWLHCCIAAGYGLVFLYQRIREQWRIPLILSIAGLLSWHTVQAQRAAFRLSSDGRNPYAYVPTSKDLQTLTPFLKDLEQVTPTEERMPIAIIGDQYWPLPWYLRTADPHGYWSNLSPEQTSLPLLIILPSAIEKTAPLLEGSHTFIPRGLRDEAPLFIAIRNDIWSNYQNR